MIKKYGTYLLLCSMLLGVQMTSISYADSIKSSVTTTKKRHTLKELRDQNIVKQRLDYSCGAAALSTLLTYYFGDDTSERVLLEMLEERLSKDQQRLKQKSGFSLLDLKYIAEAKGYQAAGFKLTIEQLKHLAAPVIVFLKPLGYRHFAVLRGIRDGRVFIADPSRGNLRMSIHRFLAEWDGIIFVLGHPNEKNITDYPLAVPKVVARPELLGVTRLLDVASHQNN